MSGVRRALIAGAGIGGLTAAVALARRGVQPVVAEQRQVFEDLGVGLGQPANALRVYRDIGVLDEILDTGFVYHAMAIFDSNHRLLARHTFLLGDRDTPAVCALSRTRLHDILLAAARAEGAEIRLGCRISSILDTGSRAEVSLTDGGTEHVDVVIGFDGIRSPTRDYLFDGAFAPRPSGFGAWRLKAPRPESVTGMEFLQGIGSKTGAMPISDDLMYLFHIRSEKPGAWYPKEDYPQMLQERLSGYGGYVAGIRDGLSASSGIVYSPLEPLLVPWPWHRGRVVIGGDAAHTVPPHLTQGAAMAVEDALVLADELCRPGQDIETSLQNYSARRYQRCAFVYAFSRQWLDEEQNIVTAKQYRAAREDIARNASARIGASDRILNSPIM